MRVRWAEVLEYARSFSELALVRGIDPSERVDVAASALSARRPRGKSLPRFGPIAAGEAIGGWRVELVALDRDVVRVLLAGADGSVVLALGPDAAPGPFDGPVVRGSYEKTRAPFASVEPAGRAIRDRIAGAGSDWQLWLREAETSSARLGTHTLPDAEAVDVRPDGKAYLRVTDACQERCTFCFFYDNPAIDNLLRDRDLDEVIARLDPNRVTQVILTGGEPTLHPRFAEYVAKLHARGLREIIVQTNGVRLAEPGALEALAPFADRLGLGFSLHAATAEVNDRVTCADKGYFPLKLEAIRRASELGFRSKITLVLSRHNLSELVPFVELCHALTAGSDSFAQVSLPSFEGRMRLFLDSYPRLGEIAIALPPALARARALGLRIALCHQCQVPPCVVPGDVQHLESLWFAATPAMWEHDRAYGPACERCAMRPWCSGVWSGYAHRFGTAELVPFAPGEVEPHPEGR